MGGGNFQYSQWIKKRLKRIAIPYFICMFFEWVILILCNSFELKEALLQLSTLSFWYEHTGYWFIALLIPLYLATPILYRLVCLNKYGIIISVIISLIIVALCGFDPIIHDDIVHNIAHNLCFAFKRSPAFIIGLSIAPYIMRGIKISVWEILLYSTVLLSLVIGARLLYKMPFWDGWTITPAIIIVLARFCSLLKKTPKTNKFITWLGNASLESYITNGTQQVPARYVATLYSSSVIFTGCYLEYLFVISMGLFTTYILHKLSDMISKKRLKI